MSCIEWLEGEHVMG